MLSNRAANTVETSRGRLLAHGSLHDTRSEQPRRRGRPRLPPAPGYRLVAASDGRGSATEYERIWSQLGSRPIEDLIDLPLMTDPASLATMDVLTKIGPAALTFMDANSVPLSSSARMVNLSLEHGNSDGSCFAFVWLGMVAGPHFGDYKAGFRFGRLGYDLVESAGLKRFRPGPIMSSAHVLRGRSMSGRPRFAAPRLSRSRTEIGDLTFAAYSGLRS